MSGSGDDLGFGEDYDFQARRFSESPGLKGFRDLIRDLWTSRWTAHGWTSVSAWLTESLKVW